MSRNLFTAESIEAMTTRTVISHHGIQRSFLFDAECLRRVHALTAELQRRAERGDIEAQKWVETRQRRTNRF